MAGTVTQNKVLLMVSGGPDSATLAQFVHNNQAPGTQIHAIYLRSGHPSDDQEIQSANRILRSVGGKLEIIDISPTIAALGANRILIHSEAAILPFGNVIALGIASSYALRLGVSKVYIGLHADDAKESIEYTQNYIKAINSLFTTARSEAPEILTPFIDFGKGEVFKLGVALGVDYKTTWSCIRAKEKHCGECGACRARRQAFNIAGVNDPTEYEREPLAVETVSFEEVRT